MTYITMVDVENIVLDDKFIMAVDSKARKSYQHGAVTTRVVTASTVEEAKEVAIEHARA